MTTDPIAAARALLDKVPPLFIDRDGDLCRAGDGHNLVGCAAWDDVAPFDYLNPVIWDAIPDLRDMVATLADALEAEQAKVAAAYEAGQLRMRELCGDMVEREGHGLHVAIRYAPLTPADAALDKLLAEARLEGWRAGRDAAAWCLEQGADEYSCGCDPIHCRCHHNIEQMRIDAEVVRALPEPKEASHDD